MKGRGHPHPGCFCKRVWNCLKTKELRFWRVQKSLEECERKGDRTKHASTFKSSNVLACFVLSPFLSHSSKLFCTLQNLNSFVFKQFQTLLQKHPGWGCPLPFIEDQNETANC